MPRVYVIILNYINWEDVAECLESLFRSHYDNYSVIVIDNDSQNTSLEQLFHWAENNTVFSNRLSYFSKNILKKPIGYTYFTSDAFANKIRPVDFPRLVFVQNKENKGFAGGINPVLQCLLKEDAYVWLLNPDMVVEESTLPGLAAFAVNNSVESIIGSVIKYYSCPGKIHLYAGGKINFNSGTIKMIKSKSGLSQMDYVSGGSLFTHINSFHNLGLLPEDYFLYWEETDWCYRAKLNGYNLQLCETAVCYDKVSASIGKSFLADYYYTRNGLIFLSKYKKSKVALAVFFTMLRFLKKIATGQPARAKGVYKGMLSFLNKSRHENK
ncbi:MAG: glycosyltransferase family 2 protein [Chitinophagaceae bacterium]